MNDTPVQYRWSARLFRGLLWTYPSEVRRHAAVEMWTTFEDRIVAARQEGWLAFTRLWSSEMAAALGHGFRERWRTRNEPKRVTVARKGDGEMQSLMEDVRYGFRTLGKSRAFTTVAALTLALGIGANTAIFTMVSGVIFFPFGFDEPERAMQIRTIEEGRSGDFVLASVPEFLDWKQQSEAFEFMAANRGATFNLTGGEEPVRVSGPRVTTDYFSVFAVEPLMGRAFLRGDDEPGAEPVVVISEGLWERELASDPDVVGRVLTLDGVAHTVVGVVGSDFALGIGVDLYTPLTLERAGSDRGTRDIVVNGRLADRVSPDQARAEFETIAARLADQYPETNEGWTIATLTWPELVRSGNMGVILIMFQVSVLFVLLIGCANVANLMLARMSSRASEVSIRVAMGAGRWRLVRQFLTEGIMLSIIGGIGGLLLSVGAVAYMRSAFESAPGITLLVRAMQIDWKVLVFAVALSVASTLFFALIPAWRGSRVDLHGTLKEGGHRSGGGTHHRLRNALVFSEVAMAGVLLISAGVLINSVIKVRTADPGFNMDQVLTMSASLSENEYPEEHQVRSFYDAAVEAIAAIPGVERAAATSELPVTLGGLNGRRVIIEGRPVATAVDQARAVEFTITPDYMRVMDIALLEGRYLSQADTARTMPVALITKAMADRYWADAEALGRRLRMGRGDTASEWITVVGIVEDVRNDDIDEPPLSKVYRGHAQNPVRIMTLAARTGGDPLTLAGDVRRSVGRIDPNLPVFNVQTVRQVVDAEGAADFVLLQIFGAFGFFALVLSAVGIYSVVSYSVSERTHEIGVRMALGAQAGNIYKQVILQGMVVTLLGLVVGVAGGYGVGLMASATLSPMIDATDPMAFAPITVTVIAVALLACYIPARRAASVDPTVALRYE